MEIRQKNLEPYLYNIALDQLMADYEAKGYHVLTHDTVGNYHPDLVARKGDEVVVFEIKAGKFTPERRKRVIEIGDYVRANKNYKFLVVLATPPRPKKINILNLDQLLYEYVIDNHPDNLFNALPHYTTVTGIATVVVDEVAINEEGSITSKGTGTVEVAVGYGPSDEDGVLANDIFPFDFDVVLKYDKTNELRLVKVNTLTFDTSSFEE